jgi:hypothetical protein
MITADLKDVGWRVSKNTFAGVMAQQSLAARPKRRQAFRAAGPGPSGSSEG